MVVLLLPAALFFQISRVVGTHHTKSVLPVLERRGQKQPKIGEHWIYFSSYSSYIVDIRSPGAFTSRPRCLSVCLSVCSTWVVKSHPVGQDSSDRLSDGTVFLTFLPWRLFFDGKWRSRLLLFLEVRFGFYFFLLKLSDGAFFTHSVRMFGISRTVELAPLNDSCY